MVTLDKIVKNVGKFEGDLKNHRAYERAKENIEVINDYSGIIKLEETLKKEAGYNEFNMPKSPQKYEIKIGDVSFSVRSEMTTKRPQYKTAATQMENYLNGIILLVSQDRVITGVAKEEKKWCISVDKLLEQYELIIAGVKSPGLKQTIKYEIFGTLASEKIKEMDLSVSSDGKLNTENFVNYVKADALRDISEKYVKAYEKELKSKDKIGDITPINTRKGFKEENSKTEGIDWAYVVKTLVNTETVDEEGELNTLADPSINLEQKKEELPFYDLFERKVYGEQKLYVGIESVYNRIQDLKEQKSITTNRTNYISKELV
ncbi:MAG: hypothetical protein ACP5N1_05980 [Candidatus Woesearchaeota archaeon]